VFTVCSFAQGRATLSVIVMSADYDGPFSTALTLAISVVVMMVRSVTHS